jgi:hypothetical protein
MLDYLKDLYHREPAVINAVATGAVLLVASLFGVVLDKVSVGTYVAGGLALLLGAGVVTRAKVKPVKK